MYDRINICSFTEHTYRRISNHVEIIYATKNHLIGQWLWLQTPEDLSSNLAISKIYWALIYWSSGYGRRLIVRRSCVQIPAPYNGWIFFAYICYKICNDNCLKRPKINYKRGRVWPIFKSTHGGVVLRVKYVDRLQLEEPRNVVEDRADHRGRDEDDLEPDPLEGVDDREEALQGHREGHQDRPHASDVCESVAAKKWFNLR